MLVVAGTKRINQRKETGEGTERVVKAPQSEVAPPPPLHKRKGSMAPEDRGGYTNMDKRKENKKQRKTSSSSSNTDSSSPEGDQLKNLTKRCNQKVGGIISGQDLDLFNSSM